MSMSESHLLSGVQSVHFGGSQATSSTCASTVGPNNSTLSTVTLSGMASTSATNTAILLNESQPTNTTLGSSQTESPVSSTRSLASNNSKATPTRAPTHSKSPTRSSTTRRTTSSRPTIARATTSKSSSTSARPRATASELDGAVQDWMTNYVHTTPRPYDGKRDCGVRSMGSEGRALVRQARVVGGRDSHQGELPWSVLIRETTLLGFFVKTKCGGVLIDLKWVLTAAHCQPGMFGSLIVVVGEYDLNAAAQSASASQATGTTNQYHRPGVDRLQRPVSRKVKRMIVHRDYNPSNFDNDIALLELDTPFQVQPHVVPICLPNKDEDFIGQLALVAGWGKLSFGGPVPKVLQVAKLPVIGNKQCQEMYHNSGHIKLISDSFLCAGYENGGQDSCEGDSGGPLQVQRADGRWVLAGTVSHGIKCAEPNLPGIYIRTAAYLPWIKAITFHQDHNKRFGPLALN